jgi:coenzyme F420-reducing hydrogenase beta subunit
MKVNLPTDRKCTGCLLCVDVCHTLAIKPYENEDGFLQIKVIDSLCVRCGNCERYCPVLSVSEVATNEITSYAAWSNDADVRKKSSSGGIFSELAMTIINQGGIVVGATNNGARVRHIAIDNFNDLAKLQGSKYQQSNTEDIYKTVKSFLRQGRKVLFSGTPCQADGIRKYCGEKLSYHLYVVDVLCHGVPSGKILDLFNYSLDNDVKSIISYRDKIDTWKQSYALSYLSQNDINVRLNQKDNSFIKLYSRDLMFRSTCYKCQFAKENRNTDITLADFWGDGKYVEQHEAGISAIICRTSKGHELLSSSRITKQIVAFKDIVRVNYTGYTSNNLLRFHPSRLFFHQITQKLSLNNQLKFFLSEFKFTWFLFPLAVYSAILYTLNNWYKNYIFSLKYNSK